MNMAHLKMFLTVILSCSCLAACFPNSASVQAGHVSFSNGSVVALQPGQRYIVDEPLGIQPSQSQAGRFNSRIIFLADQLERNADRKNLGNTFIVTSFSNLNKLSETSGFGRLAAENLIHELQVRKWQVFDIRMTKDIIVNETGEFSLSRDIKKIREAYRVGGIVTGTYSAIDGEIIINARSMDINTGIVLSSAQARMRLDWFTDALLFNGDKLRDMKIVGENQVAHGK